MCGNETQISFTEKTWLRLQRFYLFLEKTMTAANKLDHIICCRVSQILRSWRWALIWEMIKRVYGRVVAVGNNNRRMGQWRLWSQKSYAAERTHRRCRHYASTDLRTWPPHMQNMWKGTPSYIRLLSLILFRYYAPVVLPTFFVVPSTHQLQSGLIYWFRILNAFEPDKGSDLSAFSYDDLTNVTLSYG